MRHRISAAILLLALLVTACNATPKRTLPEPTPAPVEKIILKLLQEPGSPFEPMLDVLVSGFVQQYPQYQVERVAIEGDYRELNRALLDGRVDLLPVDHWSDDWTLATLVLDTYMLKSGVKLESFGPGFASHRVDGRTHYLPFALLPLGLMANADLLKQAGVSLPQGSWTWDEFRALAARVTSRDASQETWGLADLPTEMLVRIWLESQGGRPALQATDQELQSALQFFGAMAHLDKSLQPVPARQWTFGFELTQPNPQPFMEGRVGMTLGIYLDGAYDFLSLPFPLVFAPMPSHAGQRPASLGHIRALAIGSGSKHPDAAWAFVTFATGPDGAKLLASHGVLPMQMTQESKEAWFARTPTPPAFTESFFTTNWYFFRDEVWSSGDRVVDLWLLNDLHRMANRVLAQGMDASEAVKLYRAEAQKSRDRAQGR